MQQCAYKIDEILYHQAPMILIDRVDAYDDMTLFSSVEITEQSPFLDKRLMPAYVGIEYMAQSVAAFSGIGALQAGRQAKIGYLVSARKMAMKVPYFKIGDQLKIEIHLVYNETPMAVFECFIKRQDLVVATARLNVYQP